MKMLVLMIALDLIHHVEELELKIQFYLLKQEPTLHSFSKRI